MRLFLFDVDGTLVDSEVIIHECMRRTFKDFGFSEPELQQSKSIIGLSLGLAIATIQGRDEDKETDLMAARYKEVYLEIYQEPKYQSDLFEGADDLIHSLKDRPDVLLGIVTGKSRRGVTSLIENHGFDGCFVTSRCADDCPSKPHPAMVLECCGDTGIEPERAIVIGDTHFDIEMAKSAGASAIGVGWGNHHADLLSERGADHITYSMSDLQHYLHEQLTKQVA